MKALSLVLLMVGLLRKPVLLLLPLLRPRPRRLLPLQALILRRPGGTCWPASTLWILPLELVFCGGVCSSDPLPCSLAVWPDRTYAHLCSYLHLCIPWSDIIIIDPMQLRCCVSLMASGVILCLCYWQKMTFVFAL